MRGLGEAGGVEHKKKDTVNAYSTISLAGGSEVQQFCLQKDTKERQSEIWVKVMSTEADISKGYFAQLTINSL